MDLGLFGVASSLPPAHHYQVASANSLPPSHCMTTQPHNSLQGQLSLQAAGGRASLVSKWVDKTVAAAGGFPFSYPLAAVGHSTVVVFGPFGGGSGQGWGWRGSSDHACPIFIHIHHRRAPEYSYNIQENLNWQLYFNRSCGCIPEVFYFISAKAHFNWLV